MQQTSNKPSLEPELNEFTDSYIRHLAYMN